MKKILLTALLLFLTSINVNAQQSPHYTQYMYNMNIINPAYAGSKDNLSFGFLYRKQWLEIEDAPTTFSLSGSAPVGKNVGVGLSIISDKIGPVDENNIYGDFSYTLNLGGEHRLALGLKAGVTIQKIGLFSDINSSLQQQGDGAFAQDSNTANLNFGSGIFYYTNKYYVIKPFCVRSNITSSIDLFNSGTTNSGFTIYGPVELDGLNPSIIAVVASSTYLLIAK
mgnify:CR=1 FL=1